MVQEGFITNLPIVIMEIDGELPDYKDFEGSEEVVYDTDPYTTGHIEVIDTGTGVNRVSDKPENVSEMRIKKRGHTSYSYDKEQYLLKLVNENGDKNELNLLGMGDGADWVLNGSMADKSMLRNYLAYRISAEIMDTAPDCEFCEVMIRKDGGLEYEGVLLLTEAVSRGKTRVNIEPYNQSDDFSSYLIRRDRYTSFDPMLDTYGRLNGYAPEYIGVKYPGKSRYDEKIKKFIEKDFSRVEMVLYSNTFRTFETYSKYIDVQSFIDYFLLNEFFGNYDAGNHSTYMYKSERGRLKMGPVWDFDQGMDNYFAEAMNVGNLAFQTKPLYDRLTLDLKFVRQLEKEYSILRRSTLDEDHVYAVMDEAIAYLKSARTREWYRWAADYLDDSGRNPGNYYLQDDIKQGFVLTRMNKHYYDEIAVIKNYIHKHGAAMGPDIKQLEELTEFDTTGNVANLAVLMIAAVLFFVPLVLVGRK
ncbi:MAG: CotH kinase family protein [Lachnospiraceae bacterium]|nr:CotH kinase family protein [Lachnospiraceae bacterium]